MAETVLIEKLGIYGEGIARIDGYTVFVDGALPGETVEIEWTERKKTYGRASLKKLVAPSPERVIPPCPVFGKCGGCQLMHLSYEKQLEFKRERVVDAFERIGKLGPIPIEPCFPSPSQLSYRNKIQLPVNLNPLQIGLYAQNSHRLIDIDHCYIHCTAGEKIYSAIRSILSHTPFPDSLRHILIKTAVHTNQILVILVTPDSPSAALVSIAKRILDSMEEVKGVVHNLNRKTGNIILGPTFQTLAGEGAIEEKICGLIFRVSPASFFQVNPYQVENLYRKVEELAALDGTQRLLDAYCGVGTLSLILSGKAKETIGVECVPEAIRDAETNARRNGITNAKFVCDTAERFVPSLKGIDVALLNPPRKGCEPEVLQKLAGLRPSKIIYVSCDPATLARDLSFLSKEGFKVKGAFPFDLFPQTAHVETVALIER